MEDFYEEEYRWALQKIQRLEDLGQLTPVTRRYLLAAYDARNYSPEDSRYWDWTESDGCTGVSEPYWATKFFPPCVGHDYQSEMANRQLTRNEADYIRKYGDDMFYEANLAFGMPKFKCPVFGFRDCAYGRYVGVRAYWKLIGRWKVPK